MAEPARSCGDCTVCCTALAIETPELRKQPGVTCRHCTAQGCGIYETRFPICRSYFCGWFGLPELDDSWRPDRSGILLSPQSAGIPETYDAREGVEFLLLTGEAGLAHPPFIVFLRALLASRTPAFLALAGPKGHYPARVFLNDALARAVDDPPAIMLLLRRIVRSAAGHRFEPAPPP
jgi:hypothetical protein